MGTGVRDDLSTLKEDLERNAPLYNVFQAMRIAEAILSAESGAQEGEVERRIRCRPLESYVHPPADIHSFRSTGSLLEFVLTFMGLYGINSPLPRCYHDEVVAQQPTYGEGKVPLQNFLDIFNNRFYLLYYRAWKKYRLTVSETGERNRRVFLGFAQAAGRGDQKSAVPPLALMRVSTILSHRVRSKEGLRILLHEFFQETPFRIHEFVQSRLPLSDLPALGRGKPVRLGSNSVLGRSALDRRKRICIEVGPVSFSEYLEFVPGGGKAQLLRELLDVYLRDGIQSDLKLSVEATSIATVSWRDKRVRLGQSFWLGRAVAHQACRYFADEQFVKQGRAA